VFFFAWLPFIFAGSPPQLSVDAWLATFAKKGIKIEPSGVATPVQIDALSRRKMMVSSAAAATAALGTLIAGGTVAATGKLIGNAKSPTTKGLGNTTTPINVPTQITTVTFTAATNGAIAKLLCDQYTNYGRTAILTDKGKIFTTGYNGYGWMGNGNTTNLSTFTIMGSGPGAAASNTATNMWFTGNGQYHSIFMQDINGAITAAGRNVNGQLGDNSTTDRSSVVTPLWRLRSNNYNLLDVKFIGGHSSADNHRTHVLTNNGFVLVAGSNNNGCSSMGFTSANTYSNASANNIEESTQIVFQLPRMLNDAQGNVAELQSFGYGTTNYYYRLELRTNDYRYQSSGYSGSQLSSHHSSPTESQFQVPALG
jgi:alpha-tubulin suppressor-like RCC1 family protein